MDRVFEPHQRSCCHRRHFTCELIGSNSKPPSCPSTSFVFFQNRFQPPLQYRQLASNTIGE
ncbi:hypothetical protein GYMLUDRAFT_701335 [Collybiopsis luxurians FD-317 M1]|uniref:Uncharacterized protein n=1 Tax=Collybiopsis luxurians FD-317 M1 TaxID=944289 RepID=A0A0D0CRL6_9AGAR|nr:hypothetical protein GYMLUDRAFT_701335 [Collybiopsis luxurians FD-317 M1]